MQQIHKVAKQPGESLYSYTEVFPSFCQIFKHQEIKNSINAFFCIKQLLNKVNYILHIVNVFAITPLGEKESEC